MTDDQQRAREVWSDALRKVGQHEYAYHVGCGGDLNPSEQATLDAITAALRAAPEVEVVGEAWRLVNSGGDQIGGLYSSEWDASAAELKYRGSRTRTPYTVQRLEIIAARAQGVKDAT